MHKLSPTMLKTLQKMAQEKDATASSYRLGVSISTMHALRRRGLISRVKGQFGYASTLFSYTLKFQLTTEGRAMLAARSEGDEG